MYTWTLKLSPRTWEVRLNPPWNFFSPTSRVNPHDRRVFAASSLTKKKTPRIQSPQRQVPEVILWMLPIDFSVLHQTGYCCMHAGIDTQIWWSSSYATRLKVTTMMLVINLGPVTWILPSPSPAVSLNQGWWWFTPIFLSFPKEDHHVLGGESDRINQSDREKDIQSFSNTWM